MAENEVKRTYLEVVIANEDLQEAWNFLKGIEISSEIISNNFADKYDDRNLVAMKQAALNMYKDELLKKNSWLSSMVKKYAIPSTGKIEMDTGRVYLDVE